jgi:Ca2+-binding EF-hand superfamily protein
LQRARTHWNVGDNRGINNGIVASEQIAKAISKDEIFTLYTLLFSEEYNPEYFRQRIKELNMNITEQEINEMIMLGDISGKGKVSFDDFYNIITNENEK